MNTQNSENLHMNKTSPANGAKEFEEFVYLLSHDVRNSVRALVEIPQWIKEDLVAEGQTIGGSLAQNFDLMETHTGRLDRMLVDLLVYSRVGKNQTVQSVDLTEAVGTVLSQINPPVEFRITYDFAHNAISIGSLDVMTMITALISNSIKHHHRDSGVVHISSRQDGSHCVLSIRDDGPGIPEKFRDRVFEVMTTLKPRDEVEGSGMGLATTRKIVELYGGSLSWVEGVQADGSTLEMRFPI